MAELKIPQLPPEGAHRQALEAMALFSATVVQALVDKFASEEAVKILDPYLKEAGRKMGGMAETLGFTSKDAIAIGSLLHLIEEQVFLSEGKPTEVGPDRVVKDITKCPFQSFTPELCLAMMSMAEGLCEAINPEYEITAPKMIPSGDPICQWIVEKK
jgi:hypothetical protein